MLRADIIEFQAIDHASCFFQSVQLTIDLHNDEQIISYNDRLIKVGVFPVSSAGNNVFICAEDFLHEINNIKRKQQEFQIKFLNDYSRMEILDNYRKARNRLLLLDYDGTLKPFATTPNTAFPD